MTLAGWSTPHHLLVRKPVESDAVMVDLRIAAALPNQPNMSKYSAI
jgi:hypothetical protein